MGILTMKKFILSIIFLLFAVNAFSATYYIDNSATGCGGSGCSDSNNGTSTATAWQNAPGMASPWLTLTGGTWIETSAGSHVWDLQGTGLVNGDTITFDGVYGTSVSHGSVSAPYQWNPWLYGDTRVYSVGNPNTTYTLIQERQTTGYVHPGYTHVSGDVFVFKGGDTWVTAGPAMAVLTINDSNTTWMGGQQCGYTAPSPFYLNGANTCWTNNSSAPYVTAPSGSACGSTNSVSCNGGVPWGSGYPGFEILSSQNNASGIVVNSDLTSITIDGFYEYNPTQSTAGGCGISLGNTSNVIAKNNWLSSNSVNNFCHTIGSVANPSTTNISIFDNYITNSNRMFLNPSGSSEYSFYFNNVNIYNNMFMGLGTYNNTYHGDGIEIGTNTLLSSGNWSTGIYIHHNQWRGNQKASALLYANGNNGSSLTFSYITGGPFVIGETVTGSHVVVNTITGTFAVGDTIRGSSSGAIATVVSVDTVNKFIYCTMVSGNFTSLDLTITDTTNGTASATSNSSLTVFPAEQVQEIAGSVINGVREGGNFTTSDIITGGTSGSTASLSAVAPYLFNSLKNVYVYDNLFTPEGNTAGTSTYSPSLVAFYLAGFQNIYFYNNTVSADNYTAAANVGAVFYGVSGDLIIENNIFSGCYYDIDVTTSTATPIINKNIHNSTNVLVSSGNNCRSLAACQGYTWETNGISSSSYSSGYIGFWTLPSGGTTGSGNWTLQSTSPAIAANFTGAQAAQNLSTTFMTDYLNKTISAWGMGAYNYPADNGGSTTYTLTVQSPHGNITSGDGYINCTDNAPHSTGACSYNYTPGATPALTATADSGYTFSSFSGGGCSTSPCTVTMNQGYSVTASYTAIPINPYNVMVTVPLNNIGGTVTPIGNQQVASGGNTLTLTATIYNDWSLAWSGTCGGSGTTTYTTNTITQDCTVIATFSQIPPTFSGGFFSGGIH